MLLHLVISNDLKRDLKGIYLATEMSTITICFHSSPENQNNAITIKTCLNMLSKHNVRLTLKIRIEMIKSEST